MVKAKKKDKRKANAQSAFDPFVQVVKGVGELTKPFKISIPRSKRKKDEGGNPAAAIKASRLAIWLLYKFYKKAHQLLSW